MKFEEHDFAGVHEQLENIPGATMTNMLQEQFPVLGTVKEEKDSRTSKEQMVEDNVLDDKLTPQAMLCKSRIYLMQALTLYWTSGLNTLKGSRVGSLHSSAWYVGFLLWNFIYCLHLFVFRDILNGNLGIGMVNSALLPSCYSSV